MSKRTVCGRCGVEIPGPLGEHSCHAFGGFLGEPRDISKDVITVHLPTAPADDLRTLDGNALVARLAVVKERAEGDRDFYISEMGGDLADDYAEAMAEHADTEAVLDECAVRLLAVDLAPEVERLRGLIAKGAAAWTEVQRAGRARGSIMRAAMSQADWACDWGPALVAEAEKP